MCIYERRLSRLMTDMRTADTAALLLTPSPDFLYLTGSARKPAQRPVILALTPNEAALIEPGFEVGNESHRFCGIRRIPYEDGEDCTALLRPILPQSGRVAVARDMRAGLLLALQQRYPALSWQDADSLLGPMRRRKDAREIKIIEQAQHMAERALSRLLSGSLIGRTERDIAAELAKLRLDEGFDAVGSGIVASGPNTALPHHVNGERRVQAGDALMFDIGGSWQGYHADFTRTYAVGRLPEGFSDIYAIVLKAHQAGASSAVGGTRACDVDSAARQVIEHAGYGAYFTHRLGHGIGLDIHESPFIMAANTQRLEVGNVFSCEPGIYLPGRFGIRIEDLLALEPDGTRSLNTLSKELTIL